MKASGGIRAEGGIIWGYQGFKELPLDTGFRFTDTHTVHHKLAFTETDSLPVPTPGLPRGFLGEMLHLNSLLIEMYVKRLTASRFG